MSIKGFTIDDDPLVISTGQDEFILAIMTLGFFSAPGVLDLEKPCFDITWSEPWNWNVESLDFNVQTAYPQNYRTFADVWKFKAEYERREKRPPGPKEFTGFLNGIGYKDMTNYALMRKRPDCKIFLQDVVVSRSSVERPVGKKK